MTLLGWFVVTAMALVGLAITVRIFTKIILRTYFEERNRHYGRKSRLDG